MDDEAAADAVAEVLARLGEALDTGDLTGVRDVIDADQVAAYQADDEPIVDDAPFTRLPAPLPVLRIALISAGGVRRADEKALNAVSIMPTNFMLFPVPGKARGGRTRVR